MSMPAIESVVATLPNSMCPIGDVGTAGQPPEHSWTELATAGFKTVVDLRPAEEPRGYDEPAAVERAGLAYVRIPVTPTTLGDRQFDEFRALLRDPSRRPVLVHCASANRVGALLLPFLVLDEHRTPEESLRVAQQVGLRSAEYAAQAMDYVARHRAPSR